ncbi:MAG: D-alanyl-D-alanine carboxypeptidase family protein [Nitrospirota bacterium]
MKQSSVVSYQLSVKKLFFIISFFLFTVHYSLFTAFADEVRSKAVVVMDASTGKILYAKNPGLRLPPASTTKLMTAIVVMEKADLSDVVTISRNASHVSPHKAGFREGDKVTVKKLLYAALLGSANDAAVALAEATAGSEERFVYLMNNKAIAMGLKDTKFINPHGLPGPGQYITAYDLSKIMIYALRYPSLKEIIGTRVAEVSTENGNDIFLKNTNKLLWSDEDLVGGKTGYTHKARHCFVCAAERDKNTVVVALLGSPSRENLWRESEALVQNGFRAIANNEEPNIYFVKADYDAIRLKKASYKKSLKFKVKSSKLKTTKKLIAKKTAKHKKKKIFAKKKGKTKLLAKKTIKHKKTKMLAKKKGKTKMFTKYKNKNRKNYRIAEKVGDRNKG